MNLQALKEAIQQAAEPPFIEVIRAKKRIMELTEDGVAHGSDELLRSLTDLEGLEAESPKEEIAVGAQADIAQLSFADEPSVRWALLKVSAAEALGELASEGLLLPIQEWKQPLQLYIGRIHVGAQSEKLTLHPRLPLLAESYRQPFTYRQRETWFLDPNLFLIGTEQAPLDDQTHRCLVEGLEAYRRGLYLATANLIGAVSEGAWFAAARRLADDEKWNRLKDQAPAKLQKWVYDRLRSNRDTLYTAEELATQAITFRELRDFGVHPHRPMGDVEKYFNQTECGLLFLTLHRYLVRLAGAVQDCL